MPHPKKGGTRTIPGKRVLDNWRSNVLYVFPMHQDQDTVPCSVCRSHIPRLKNSHQPTRRLSGSQLGTRMRLVVAQNQVIFPGWPWCLVVKPGYSKCFFSSQVVSVCLDWKTKEDIMTWRVRQAAPFLQYRFHISFASGRLSKERRYRANTFGVRKTRAQNLWGHPGFCLARYHM